MWNKSQFSRTALNTSQTQLLPIGHSLPQECQLGPRNVSVWGSGCHAVCMALVLKFVGALSLHGVFCGCLGTQGPSTDALDLVMLMSRAKHSRASWMGH